MALTNFKRVLQFASVNFFRNKGTSVAAIFILMITTLLVTSLFLLHGMSNFLVTTLQNKIDITAYFKSEASEESILVIRDEILKNSPDIKNIQYVSKEDALKDFIEKNKDNEVFSKALSEVGGNPFLPALNITTSGNPAQYQQISTILEEDKYKDFIEKVDFSQKKDTIEKVFSITSNVNKFGIGLGLILILVAISVVFNTIKLVVDHSRDEISTMRIVGASNWFLRAPFILEGVLFGLVSFFTSFFITIFLVYAASGGVGLMMPGFNLSSYFISHLWLVILIQLACGVGLAVISSYIAVRKYLEI